MPLRRLYRRPSPPCSRIVGIAGDARRNRLRRSPTHYYIPFGQESGGFGGTAGPPRPGSRDGGLGAPADLLAADPSIGYVDIRLLQDAVDPQIRPWRLGASMFTLMGGLTLLVAALGLYSLISYLVAWRTRELGVRMALGATGWRIARLVVRGAVGAALGGTVIGVGLALAAGRWVAPLLFDTAPTDPAVFGTVVAVLLAVAVLAALGPALRAGRANPSQSLRAE
ncbi:MAG: FtsX-like permease family protein [Gemmatimonadales bacterium]